MTNDNYACINRPKQVTRKRKEGHFWIILLLIYYLIGRSGNGLTPKQTQTLNKTCFRILYKFYGFRYLIAFIN